MKGDPYGPATSRVPHPDHSIGWYRTEIKPEVHRALHKKSDAKVGRSTLFCTIFLRPSFFFPLHISLFFCLLTRKATHRTQAWFQTLSFLGMLASSFSLALYFHSQGNLVIQFKAQIKYNLPNPIYKSRPHRCRGKGIDIDSYLLT